MSKKSLVVLSSDGEMDVFERIELAPNAVEYRRLHCEVIDYRQASPVRNLTLWGVAMGFVAWTAQFGLGKLYDAVLSFVMG